MLKIWTYVITHILNELQCVSTASADNLRYTLCPKIKWFRKIFFQLQRRTIISPFLKWAYTTGISNHTWNFEWKWSVVLTTLTYATEGATLSMVSVFQHLLIQHATLQHDPAICGRYSEMSNLWFVERTLWQIFCCTDNGVSVNLDITE